MNYLHNANIEKINREFHQILHVRDEIQQKHGEIQEKLGQLKEIHNGLIKNNNKKIFLFCLDSFYFHYKVLMIEMENLGKYISLINNRMYGDFYKLYNMILMQTTSNQLTSASESKKYQVYKDLEPYREYNSQDTVNLHQDIMAIMKIRWSASKCYCILITFRFFTIRINHI